MKKIILCALAATSLLALSNCACHQRQDTMQQQTTMDTRSGK